MADADFCSRVNIKVIGLGGSGCNAVTRMVRAGIRGVEFIALNTDRQSLELCEAPVRIQLGRLTAGGHGAGGNRETGRKAAEESHGEIADIVSGTDLVFIICGMGGGTGAGAAQVVAEIARKSGALTVAVIAEPFFFEGRRHREINLQGITVLLSKVDSFVLVPNYPLLDIGESELSVEESFHVSDRSLFRSVQVISGVLNTTGIINLDFADIKALLKNSGPTFMSIGTGRGPDRAAEAARSALSNLRLNIPAGGAKGILFNVFGNERLTLEEVNNAAKCIRKVAVPEANIIFGITLDPTG